MHHSARSVDNQKPHKYFLFWLIAQRPQAHSPTKEWYFFSKPEQEREPKAIGRRRRPDRLKSKRHTPVFSNLEIASRQSLVTLGCIKIQPIPSALQSVFKNVGLEASNRAKTGAEVMDFFKSENKAIVDGVHAKGGIFWRKYSLHRRRRGFKRISK